MVAVTTTLRPMEATDLSRVAALERRAFTDPWSKQSLAQELALADRRYVVADDIEVVGYGGMMLIADEAHVLTLAVDPDRRRQRIGTRLLLWLAEEAIASDVRHLTLEVRVSNNPARSLYQRFGFEPAGLRRRYYRDEDALIMWARDIGSPAGRQRLAAIREGLT